MSNVKGFTNTQKIKEEAANWLLMIDENSPLSPSDVEALRRWINTSDVHKEVIVRMSKTWNDLDVLAAMRVVPESKSSSIAKRVTSWLGKLYKSIFNPEKEHRKGRMSAIKMGALSCTVLIGVVLIGLLSEHGDFRQDGYYQTAIGEYQKHTLEDGSTLWLNSDSVVKVDFSPAFRRISLVKGEAHFDVQKDASRPFEVYSSDRLVRAIGTAFSVHRLKERIEVLVSEGTVEVAIVDNVLVLTPDDAISQEHLDEGIEPKEQEERNKIEEAKVSKYLGKVNAGESMAIPMVSTAVLQTQGNANVIRLDKNEIGRKLSWLDGKLVFAGESLEEVVNEISRHTSIKIDVPDPDLRKMRIGGHFKAGETDKLFYILESGFGIEVNKIDENHVELSTKK